MNPGLIVRASRSCFSPSTGDTFLPGLYRRSPILLPFALAHQLSVYWPPFILPSFAFARRVFLKVDELSLIARKRYNRDKVRFKPALVNQPVSAFWSLLAPNLKVLIDPVMLLVREQVWAVLASFNYCSLFT